MASGLAVHLDLLNQWGMFMIHATICYGYVCTSESTVVVLNEKKPLTAPRRLPIFLQNIDVSSI